MCRLSRIRRWPLTLAFDVAPKGGLSRQEQPRPIGRPALLTSRPVSPTWNWKRFSASHNSQAPVASESQVNRCFISDDSVTFPAVPLSIQWFWCGAEKPRPVGAQIRRHRWFRANFPGPAGQVSTAGPFRGATTLARCALPSSPARGVIEFPATRLLVATVD